MALCPVWRPASIRLRPGLVSKDTVATPASVVWTMSGWAPIGCRKTAGGGLMLAASAHATAPGVGEGPVPLIGPDFLDTNENPSFGQAE